MVAVILFHADVLGVRGGYIGVDVFFVVSGYLITRLMARELADTGALSLTGFWARRMRRLLPASATMLAATVVASLVVLSPLALYDLARDTVASATYSSNFVFSARLGDYFGGQLEASRPSPLLHMWSLAVEEQFYVVWPVVMWLLVRKPREYRRLVLGVIAVGFVVGTAISTWMAATAPSAAFFLLPARLSELLAGAGLAMIGLSIGRIPAAVRAVGGWVGLAAIAVACVTFDSSMPWPGIGALVPVLATVAVIAAGGHDAHPMAPARLLSGVPMQWIGRHSYALYLWHWPVLVLCAAQFGTLGVAARLAAIGGSFGLAWLSFRLVENPTRHSTWLSAQPVRSLALGTTFCVLFTAVGWRLATDNRDVHGSGLAAAPTLEAADAPAGDDLADQPVTGESVADAATDAATDASATEATAAVEPEATMAEADALLTEPLPPTGKLKTLTASTQKILARAVQPQPVPANLTPSLKASRTRSKVYSDGCVNIGANDKLQPCRYGKKGAARTMLLYGDSHAAQWFEPINAIASANGYELVVLLKAGCPVMNVTVPTPVLVHTCPRYRQRAAAWIQKNKPDVVIVSNSYTHAPASAESWVKGTTQTMKILGGITDNLVIIGDNPGSRQDPPSCLSDHLDDSSACAVPRDQAVLSGHIAAEVNGARSIGALFVDTSNWFCTPTECPMVIGNVLVLRDETHLTSAATNFVRPLVAAALAPALR